MLDGELLAEEVERVDPEQSVRASGDVAGPEEELVAVRRQRLEELEEEQRHDREVVAAEPSRGQAEEQPDDRPEHDDRRNREHRPHVDPVVVGVEQRVRVRAEAVERDVAEVEQAAPADDDVQPERKQHVQHGVEADAADVAAAREHGQ